MSRKMESTTVVSGQPRRFKKDVSRSLKTQPTECGAKRWYGPLRSFCILVRGLASGGSRDICKGAQHLRTLGLTRGQRVPPLPHSDSEDRQWQEERRGEGNKANRGFTNRKVRICLCYVDELLEMFDKTCLVRCGQALFLDLLLE